MTRRSLFGWYAVTSFLVTMQYGLAKEVKRAQTDKLNAVRRDQQQKAAERLLDDIGM